MQAHFVAITHNLLLFMQDLLQQQGVEKLAEKQRKQARLQRQEKALEQKQQTLPKVYQAPSASPKQLSNSSAGCALAGTSPPQCPRLCFIQNTSMLDFDQSNNDTDDSIAFWFNMV